MPFMAKDKGIFWPLRPKYPLPTHRAEVKGMASPAQTVVGKDKSNPLIAEGLLKILRVSQPTYPHGANKVHNMIAKRKFYSLKFSFFH